MNKFTKPQRETIAKLAGSFFDTVIDTPETFDKEVREMFRQQYIEAIIEGLTDPSYWGN